ncbi:hypothetical protein [Deinococcus radiotolerans]|uniref:Uncharacterized protein n=1 Tax=Deinococcus radiotolerans TaxID=1309407 RepID=A0ABQ2FQ89_9DEIO|nr:hypothetical protein [Deinococcus radiotolerans]GGL16001.1 hypothetical protein GCM10010844_38620 [Deinococcus radiotolerans]
MQRYALIRAGTVGVVLITTPLTIDAIRNGWDHIEPSETAEPGWTWDGETLSPPPEPDPVKVERAEVKQLLEGRIALFPRLLATRATTEEQTDLLDEIEEITQYLRGLEE